MLHIVNSSKSLNCHLLYINNNLNFSVQSNFYHTVNRIKLAARPNGLAVTDFVVNEMEYGFNITMTAANCGYGFPLLGFEESNVVAGSAALDSDSVVYSSSSFTGSANVQVTRAAEATVPVSGTFTLENTGNTVECKSLSISRKSLIFVNDKQNLWLYKVNVY